MWLEKLFYIQLMEYYTAIETDRSYDASIPLLSVCEEEKSPYIYQAQSENYSSSHQY